LIQTPVRRVGPDPGRRIEDWQQTVLPGSIRPVVMRLAQVVAPEHWAFTATLNPAYLVGKPPPVIHTLLASLSLRRVASFQSKGGGSPAVGGVNVPVVAVAGFKVPVPKARSHPAEQSEAVPRTGSYLPKHKPTPGAVKN